MRMSVLDEFINGTVDSVEVAAVKKIHLLEDLLILKRKGDKNKKELLLEYLLKCSSEHEMTRMLHDVVRGDETIEELLARKERLND